MRTVYVPKVFRFEEPNRSRITLGTDVRLNPKTNRLQLKESSGSFPTTANLYAKTWLANPASVKEWSRFQAIDVHYKDESATVVTSVGYRVSLDGVAELYWDGGSWTTPGANDWNTEAEINAGLPSLSVAEKKIQFVVNLATSDARFSPEVVELRLAYKSDVNYQEDYVRSLLRALRTSIRPIAEYAVRVPATTLTIDLDAVESPYNIAGVDSAFNLTADPDLQNDIFSSYDPGTKVVTLSTPVPANEAAWIRFTYEPEVALTTSQDYVELAKVPAIVIEDVSAGSSHELPRFGIVNKATGDALIWEEGFQVDLDVPMRLVTDKAVDQQRLADAVKSFFADNPFLVSLARDEKYRLWLLNEYDQATFPTRAEIHSGRVRARVAGALFFPLDARAATGVSRFLVTGGNVEVEVT